MKHLLLIYALLFSVLVTKAQDVEIPSVDEIIASYLENTGGVDKWKSLSSMKMHATMSMQGMEFPGIIYNKRPNMQRVEISVQGKQLVQAYDGETAWWINPFMGSLDPQPMPAELSEEMIKDRFEDSFIDYAEKGHQVEYEGIEEIDGVPCYILKLIKADSDTESHYFDTEYLVPIMQRTIIQDGPMKGQSSDTYLSDYQEVDGLMFPHFIETKVGGQTIQKITVSSIELNTEMSDELFAYPKAK